jgi:hypothetical protein
LTLYSVAYSCRLFSEYEGFSSSWNKFREGTRPYLDLANHEHRLQTLNWLNKWLCRIKKKGFDVAEIALSEWFLKWKNDLIDVSKSIEKMDNGEIVVMSHAYLDLRAMLKRTKIKNIGGTVASKVLFALRPKAAPMWDGRIREKLQMDDLACSYHRMVEHARTDALHLIADASKHAVLADAIPAKVGRPRETLLKLVDEFHYITITAGHAVPSQERLREWIGWAG